MTQPDKPVPARGARPQLFGEPSASKASKSRHPDFGPSILATIDGTPRRDPRVRDATPLKRVLWMSLLAIGVVVVYFAVKFGMLPEASSSPAATPTVVAAQTPAPEVKVVEPVAPAAPAASAAASATGGAASIENVAMPAVAAASAASAATPAPNVAASLNNIQQVLSRAEAPEPRKAAAAKPVAPKDTPAAKDATMATRSAPPPPKPSAKAANDDAELLAAMLPHLKRGGPSPTSPAYEKRCGQLAGDAAVECRVKFCNGREGVDAACPSAVSR